MSGGDTMANAPEGAQATSEFPPPPKVVPIPTAATNAFLDRPVFFFRHTARDVLRSVAGEHIKITRPRRECIEEMLERLADLRDSLVAKLDALDADPDLEPFLSASEWWNQRQWGSIVTDDREDDDFDREPNLSATNAIDQRAWSMGGATDLEWEHDGREPSLGWANPQFGTLTPWLTDGGIGADAEDGRP